MPNHYFSENPDSKHNINELSFLIREKSLTFFTDSGVFSRTRIDPGSILLIETVAEDLKRDDLRILDLGCGFGAIGLSLASIMPLSEVLLCDINTRAVDLCNRNIVQNKLENARACVSDGLSQITPDEKIDVIVCNPPIRAGKAVIYDFFAQSRKKLGSDGVLYIVIRKQQGAPSAKSYLQTIFPFVDTISRGGGYHIIKAVCGD